jgi:hypothetical protein
MMGRALQTGKVYLSRRSCEILGYSAEEVSDFSRN